MLDLSIAATRSVVSSPGTPNAQVTPFASRQATSDAAIVSGLIALLLRIYNDRTPADILESSPDFVSKLGFEQHLSPTRSNGLASMLQAIHDFASEAAPSVR